MIFHSRCHHLKQGNKNLLRILSFKYRAASYGKVGSILNKINSVASSIMQIAFFVFGINIIKVNTGM